VYNMPTKMKRKSKRYHKKKMKGGGGTKKAKPFNKRKDITYISSREYENIGVFMDYMQNIKKIVEKKEDIETAKCNDNSTECIKCKICGSISGKLKDIFHLYTCKYYIAPLSDGPYTTGILKPCTSSYKAKTLGILQHEYGIISNNTDEKIIGSHSAGPCVILCMRNRNTTETILAHIDAMTIDWIVPFRSFPTEQCDVFVIGGNTSSIQMVYSIIQMLYSANYTITFAYIIDLNANSFAIDCMTGDTYLNSAINPQDFSVNDPVRTERLHMITRLHNKLPLNKVYNEFDSSPLSATAPPETPSR